MGGTLTVRGTGIAHIHLTSPDHARLPTGTAEVSRDGTRYAVMVIVGGLRPPPPESAYALWLAGGPAKSHLLGIVTPGVGVKGHVLRVAGPVPADVLSYRRLVITLGHKAHPRLLGQVVLQGPLTGGK